MKCSTSRSRKRPKGITLHLEIAGGAFARLKERRRSLAGRTGCGLCGAESLTQVVRDLPPVADGAPFPLAALHEGMRRLPTQQALQQTTGAVHAACRVAADGSISHVREDIGRHNALDKTLGALAAADAAAEGALIITSRASFEMVQKSAALGYGILAAVSAPTAAAVRLADKLNLTLVGFLRGDNCAIYTHAKRLQGSDTMNTCQPDQDGQPDRRLLRSHAQPRTGGEGHRRPHPEELGAAHARRTASAYRR